MTRLLNLIPAGVVFAVVGVFRAVEGVVRKVACSLHLGTCAPA